MFGEADYTPGNVAVPAPAAEGIEHSQAISEAPSGISSMFGEADYTPGNVAVPAPAAEDFAGNETPASAEAGLQGSDGSSAERSDGTSPSFLPEFSEGPTEANSAGAEGGASFEPAVSLVPYECFLLQTGWRQSASRNVTTKKPAGTPRGIAASNKQNARKAAANPKATAEQAEDIKKLNAIIEELMTLKPGAALVAWIEKNVAVSNIFSRTFSCTRNGKQLPDQVIKHCKETMSKFIAANVISFLHTINDYSVDNIKLSQSSGKFRKFIVQIKNKDKEVVDVNVITTNKLLVEDLSAKGISVLVLIRSAIQEIFLAGPNVDAWDKVVEQASR
jgi:hypothetical protein